MNAKNIIELLEDHIVDNCTAIDREKAFDDMLDECYSFKNVGGPFEHMSPSCVLKECDPTAHRCGVNDYMDSLGTVEVKGNSYEQDEAERSKEEFIDTIDDAISDTWKEIEEEEEQDDQDIEQLTELKAKLADLKKALANANNHSF